MPSSGSIPCAGNAPVPQRYQRSNAYCVHSPSQYAVNVQPDHVCSLFHFHCWKHHSQLDLQVNLEDALLASRP